ncbi:MAG: hypothetical protein J7J54_02200 [Candidatus Omnitrophica bacterium]|nr:hypothetical protein [Candidatus Omnitrophota bacterium]
MENRSFSLIFDKDLIPPCAFSEVDDKKSIKVSNWQLICNFDGDKCGLHYFGNDSQEMINLIKIEKKQAEKLELKRWINCFWPCIVLKSIQLDEKIEKSSGG